MTLQGDKKVTVDFLKAFRPGGPWIVTAIDPYVDTNKVETKTFTKSQTKALNKWLEEKIGVANLYFQVNPADGKYEGAQRPQKTDIASVEYLHVDIDAQEGEDPELAYARAHKNVEKFEPAPTFVIDSGGGLQAFWRLEEAFPVGGDMDNASQIEAYNRQIMLMMQGDHCHNIDRIMRLPGTINVLNQKKKAAGREPTVTRLVTHEPDNIYPLSMFTAAANVQQIGDRAGGAPKIRITRGELPKIILEDLPSEVPDWTLHVIKEGKHPTDPYHYQSRSDAVWAVLCALARVDIKDETMAAIILDRDFLISAHVLDQPYPERYAERQIEKAREHAINPALRELNEKHAVIRNVGGKCKVVDILHDEFTDRERVTLLNYTDFVLGYANRHIPVSDKKTKPLGKWWFEHPARRQYNTMTFAPGRDLVESYNLWRGFAFDSLPGDCNLFIEHIENNVCKGDQTNFEYLMNWMARAVQHPDRQGEIAVVLQGKQGTGKGFFAEHFGKLFGQHFLQISDSKHLAGAFNAHLRDCVVLFADEAYFAGDRSNEGTLKRLITEGTLTIEAKGVDTVSTPNFLHVIMASNQDWVIPASFEERRFFVLSVGEEQMQDEDYFEAAANQLESGGYSALLHLLKTRDISKFNVRGFPRTEALKQQKSYSFNAEISWWFDKLVNDDIPVTVPRNDFYEDYIRYCKQRNVRHPTTKHNLGRVLKRVSGKYWKTGQKVKGTAQDPTTGQWREEWVNGYIFPHLADLRKVFDHEFGGPYEWDEIEAGPETPDGDNTNIVEEWK